MRVPPGTPLEVLAAMLGVPATAVYTFVDKDTGQPTHIDVTALASVLAASSLVPMNCEIGDTLAEALEHGRLGVEEEHALKLPDTALDTPGIVCQWGEFDHVVADGAHRLWRRWKRGDKTFRAYVIPERVWRAFEIPADLMPRGGDGEFWADFNRTAKVR